MKRRLSANQIITTFTLIWLCGSLLSARHVANADDRPNIVVLFTDDQSWFSTGATGNGQVKTPNMDRLAAEGLLFSNHYDSTAICMGSRASLMTGMYEYKTGCNFSHGPMRPATFERSYPVLLQQAGYKTAFGGKFGFAISGGSSESDKSYNVLPVERFDAWAGGVGQTNYATAKNKYLAKYADRYPHSSRAYGAFGQDFIRESVRDGSPFCLTLFFKAPHRPFTPDPFFDSVYEDVTFEKPSNYGRAAGKHLSMQSHLGRQFLSFFEDMGFDSSNYQATMRKYHQLIHGVDYAIGMLREELERQGVADNTVILLTSDNGFFCGAHGFGGKVLPYQEGSRVPMVIYDPRVRRDSESTRTQAVTGTVDVAPTVLDWAGVDIPENMDGKSVIDVIQDPASRVRDSLPLFQVWGTPMTFSMSVVSQTHKYIYWCYGEGMGPAEELFDLEQDPMEMENLAGDAASSAILQQMRRRYSVQLEHWKTNAVSYNDYQPFGTILDPEVPWDDKKQLITDRMHREYEKLKKGVGVKADASFQEVIDAVYRRPE